MSAPQNFRTAFNGFHREDVVRYLEYLNNKHQSQVNQLTSELEELRANLDRKPEVEDQSELVASLQEECAALNSQIGDLSAEKAELEARVAELEQQVEEMDGEEAEQKATVLSATQTEELEAYRRAERIEREAKERSELVYFQANSVLTEASAKVDGLSADITDLADQVMQQLTQLQMAVSSSKQALQDAASIMNTIKPNK